MNHPLRSSAIAAIAIGAVLTTIGASVALIRRWTQSSLAYQKPRKLIGLGTTIAIVGDSIGQGLAPHFDALAAAGGARLVYSGAQKSTLIPTWSRSKTRIDAVLSFAPSVILISLGTNDAASAHPEAWASEVERLTSALSAKGAQLVWIDSPSEGLANLATVRSMIAASPDVASGKVMLFDSQAAKIPLGPDHVHPTAEGYKKLAQAVWSAIS